MLELAVAEMNKELQAHQPAVQEYNALQRVLRGEPLSYERLLELSNKYGTVFNKPLLDRCAAAEEKTRQLQEETVGDAAVLASLHIG